MADMFLLLCVRSCGENFLPVSFLQRTGVATHVSVIVVIEVVGIHPVLKVGKWHTSQSVALQAEEWQKILLMVGVPVSFLNLHF